MNRALEADDATALLRAQLADLARFRDMVEAQHAVLRMDDPQLLGAYVREATEIAAAVLARESVLFALRSVAQATRRAWDPHLDAEVQRAASLASAESLALTRQMEQSAQDIARELDGVGRRLDQVVGRQLRRDAPGEPVMVDRIG